MSKPENGQDRIHREIEELLDRLDNFVPEERLATKIRNRTRRQSSESPGLPRRVATRLGRVSLGQLILAGFALIIVAWLLGGRLGGLTPWLVGAGLILAGGAFLLSVLRGGGSRTLGGSVEKRWRGQVIQYSAGPSAVDRIRNWFRRRRR